KARQTAARIGSPKAVVRLLGGFVGFMSRRTGGGLLGFREHATQVVTFGSVRDRRAMHERFREKRCTGGRDGGIERF
ncbi:MAG TPA: hypothetical protein VGA48_07555, partial [Thermoplasmata archaeon]